MPTAAAATPASSAAVPAAPAVCLRDIRVAFGQTVALDGVSLDLVPGSRHAVVGENGAGKSTLMKVLFGLLAPDAGSVVVDGTPRAFASPADAIALGIGMVHQHFELIAPFTVAENVVLGSETVRGPILDRRAAEEAVRALADESGLGIDPRARVEDLSVASQQRVEILKALYRRARVLILDEPTAVLAPSEARDLWAATRRLSEAGATVVFITHKLDEVMAHAETVTVLRRGVRVLSKGIGETSPEELAGAMVGAADFSPVQEVPPKRAEVATQSVQWAFHRLYKHLQSCGVYVEEAKPDPVNHPTLLLQHGRVIGRKGELLLDDANLDLWPGEIVGIAGVDGSGQVPLIEALVGLRAFHSGVLTIGNRYATKLTLRQRRELGLAYVPEDRHHRALVLPFSCEENAILGREREPEFAGVGGILKRGAIRAFLTDRAREFDVRGAAPGVPARALSGGNQQKLVLARELSRRPRLLLASQPTRGLDFAASRFVHDALRAERDRGVAVLVQSLDLAEVLALADRVAVMLRGKIVAILPGAEATEARVGALMTGAAS